MKHILFLLVLISSHIEAMLPPAYVGFGVAYKSAYVSSDPIEFKNVSVLQGGLKGRIALPNLWSDCCYDYWFLDQFFFKGNAWWGSLEGGTFKWDNLTGSVKKGHSRDFDFAFGWFYPVADQFSVGPVVGYAYDHLDNKTGSSTLFFKYNTTFKGPYVGVDAAYENCDWRFIGGYAYYFPIWNGNYSHYLDSFHWHAHRGTGQAGYCEIRWLFSDDWEFSTNFRYEMFESGKVVSDAPFQRAKWRAIQIGGELAFRF